MTPDQAQRIEAFHRQHAPLQPWVLEAIAEDPALFGYVGPTRGELRALPIEVIYFAQPPLVFPASAPAAPLLHELADWRARCPKDIKDLPPGHAYLARRAWIRLVEWADGMNMLIAPDVLITVPLRDA